MNVLQRHISGAITVHVSFVRSNIRRKYNLLEEIKGWDKEGSFSKGGLR